MQNKQRLCINLLEKSERDVVLVAIFCFANLKVKDTKYKTFQTDSAHPNYVKTSL